VEQEQFRHRVAAYLRQTLPEETAVYDLVHKCFAMPGINPEGGKLGAFVDGFNEALLDTS